MKVFEIITYCCVGIALLILYAVFTSPMSAPQEAAAIALAGVIVVIPYCLHGAMYRAAMVARVDRLTRDQQNAKRDT